MAALNILLGLLGLGIVILVHELGHFAAAKASGITVEAFSIGWGKVLFKRMYRGTEYRLSMLPIGGYCKMKGEEFFREAKKGDDTPPPVTPGSLFSVSPLKRAFTYLAGPLANFIFSILALSVIWFAGFTIHTLDNKLILQSETIYSDGTLYPADTAGLATGDVIVEIAGKPVESFRDIERQVTPGAEKELEIVVSREGRLIQLMVIPSLDTETGAGKIGIVAWVDPVISTVAAGSVAETAGLLPGDRILTVNGGKIEHSVDLETALREISGTASIEVDRNGAVYSLELPIIYDENNAMVIGFSFETVTILDRERNPFKAITRGVNETFSTLALSVRSIGLLFSGVNVRSAVSGPIRITYFVGQVATQGFGQGMGRGLIILFRFLSMLSVAICFMNLLPIPALDGGFILISLLEIILKKPVRPKFFFRYQIVGFAIIFGILILTLFNDIFFLIGQ
jgi:regulator of sigma E protease